MWARLVVWFKRARKAERDEGVEELNAAREEFRKEVERLQKRSHESQARPAVRVVEKVSEA